MYRFLHGENHKHKNQNVYRNENTYRLTFESPRVLILLAIFGDISFGIQDIFEILYLFLFHSLDISFETLINRWLIKYLSLMVD